MTDHEFLTAFQVEVAHICFELEAADGYVVAGGAALLASDLIERPTADLDLFASTPVTSVTEAKGKFPASARWTGLRGARPPGQPNVLQGDR